MKTAAVIAEFNPLHNGHADLMRKIREDLHADRLIVLMSGDFVQRGEPALMNKHRRASAALESGADLVLQLPVVYTLAPAELYARGAILTLNAAGIVDTLVFGSESGDLSALRVLADAIPADADDAFRLELLALTKEGKTYPKAFAQALSKVHADHAGDVDPDLLSSPNNMLAVEYLRSLAFTESRIQPVTIARSPYSDRITSATQIRGMILNGSDQDRSSIDGLSSFLPEASMHVLKDIIGTDTERPVSTADLSAILSYCLIRTDPAELSEYGDISASLANRIAAMRLQCNDFEVFAARIKSRSTTLARVRRCLTQLILGIRRDTRDALLKEQATVLRVLGFRESARDLLNKLGAHASAPLISRGADFKKAAEQDPLATLVRLDLTASALYDQLSVTAGDRAPEEAKPLVIRN